MSDYIKREDAQNIIDEVLSDYLTDSERTMLEDVNAEIGEIPSADVEPVVRCKDCKWWDGNDCKARDIDVVDVDDFCSYGERRSE